mmetsp:Transcript_37231/g.102394  ORF Transcript_37231/g.102394 Transcript_37231/m.102394 type:complete len:123 (-) Transcript_37231:23-391(-)
MVDDGGVMALEGLAGMTQRPGLQEGFHRFMVEAEAEAASGPGGRLVPFLWAGKRGGLFLADERHAVLFQKRLEQTLGAKAFFNYHFDTKFLYGSRVLMPTWRAELRDFENLLSAQLPALTAA